MAVLAAQADDSTKSAMMERAVYCEAESPEYKAFAPFRKKKKEGEIEI